MHDRGRMTIRGQGGGGSGTRRGVCLNNVGASWD